MKKFIIGSYQLTENKKWAPCGMLFDCIGEAKINLEQADIFPPDYRFDTKEEADEFFKKYFLSRGYTEDEYQ